jgi:hypothetical protein
MGVGVGGSGVEVWVGVGVTVGVGVKVGVAGDAVSPGNGVRVGVDVSVGVGVKVGVEVRVALGVADGGSEVGVWVGGRGVGAADCGAALQPLKSKTTAVPTSHTLNRLNRDVCFCFIVYPPSISNNIFYIFSTS